VHTVTIVLYSQMTWYCFSWKHFEPQRVKAADFWLRILLRFWVCVATTNLRFEYSADGIHPLRQTPWGNDMCLMEVSLFKGFLIISLNVQTDHPTPSGGTRWDINLYVTIWARIATEVIAYGVAYPDNWVQQKLYTCSLSGLLHIFTHVPCLNYSIFLISHQDGWL